MENMGKGLTVPKFGQKYPKCPQIYLPKMSAQAQMFGISMRKVFIGRP